MKKAKHGFTLVEVIVVIAIIGILSVVLVPKLMGYIKKAKLSTANTNAKLIYDELTYNSMELQFNDKSVSNFKLSESDLAESTGDCVKLSKWLESDNCMLDRKTISEDGYVDIIYQDGYPTGVAWADSNDSNALVGRYPEKSELEDNVTWQNWDNNISP